MKRINLFAVIAAFALCFAVVWGNAQSTSGTILGTVADESGAVLSNTTVQLINTGTLTKTQTVSNDSGYYQFVDVSPGTYRIVVQKEGFKQLSRPGIILQTEARIQIDLTLSIGTSSETVVVTASSPLIQADNVSLGTVIDERETNELPLNGRNPMNLTAVVASVVPLGQTSGSPTGVNPFGWGNYQIGGGMAGQSNTYIDGAPDNGIYFHNTEIIPSQDSIQEFKVETNNLSAEYGELAGGAINFTTKSGTKNFHANAWEYIRNKVLNANDYYSNQNHIPRGEFTQNQYGFNIGGPVLIPHLYDGRKRTFFFVNWEGFNLRQGLSLTTSVPDKNELNGDLSEWASVYAGANGGAKLVLYDPNSTCTVQTGCAGVTGKGANFGDRLPIGWDTGLSNYQFQTTNPTMSGYINPVALAYLKKFMPGPTGSGVINNFTSKSSSGGNNYQTVARIDHDFSERHHLSGRYTYWKNLNLAVDPLGTGICANGSCAENYAVHNVIFDDTYTLSAKTVLDMRLSYGRFDYGRTPLVHFDVTSIGWPSEYQGLLEFAGPSVMQIPNLDQAGLFNGQGADSTIVDAQDTYRLAGTLSRFVGNHTLKFGGEYTVQRFNYAQTNTSSGMWYFGPGWTSANAKTGGGGLDVASYLLGYPNSGGSWYDNKTASASHYPAVFATDDWRATQKLTIHVGIRWEDIFPYSERHDRVSTFDPTKPNDVLAAAALPGVTIPLGNVELVNSAERPSRYGIDPNNMEISPRAGVSYRLFPNTVLTTGYGIFWLPMDITTGQNPGWDGTSSFTTPYVGSADGGLTPNNSISTPWPIDPSTGQAYIIKPPGRSTTSVNGKTVYQYQVNTLGNGVGAMFPNDPWGYAQQWNFGVQQQFGKTTALDVAYSGSKGTHLPFGGINRNQLPDSDLAQGNALGTLVNNPYYDAIPDGHSLKTAQITTGQTLLPFPEYTGVTANGSHVGGSSYNALEAKLTKRFSQGASLNVAYTYSKLLSNTEALASWLESISGIQDNNNLKGEKSVSSTSTPQRLVVAYVYDLPVGRGKAFLGNLSRPADYVIGGWGLQGMTTLMKGFPLGLSDSNNTSNSYGGGQRPNVVPGCKKTLSGAATKKLGQWFNTACFTQASAYTFGNESRLDPTMKAPGVANWDLSIVKKFSLDEDGRINLQFRSEFYNLFNRVQFGVPNTSIGSPSAGVISGIQNLPRVAQFALRFTY